MGERLRLQLQGDAVALEISEHAEQREIGFGGGFVQPLHAVGPGAVVDDVGQMRVQGEGEKSRSCRLYLDQVHTSDSFCGGSDGRFGAERSKSALHTLPPPEYKTEEYGSP